MKKERVWAIVDQIEDALPDRQSMKIRDMPVMPACCASCPFLQVDGRERNRDLANAVRARWMNGSQVCHHPRLSGGRETHLCRGARDHQLSIFYRIGFLSEPTDAAWAEAAQALE